MNETLIQRIINKIERVPFGAKSSSSCDRNGNGLEYSDFYEQE
jgi:hypothetical protein